MNYLGKDVELKVVGTRPIRPDGVEKVIGRAAFGADFRVAGMIHGKVLRSPHAHARIKSIDTSKAETLKGVKAVITANDLPNIPSEEAFVGEGPANFRDMSLNTIARDKVLYDGHAVAAVAATSPSIAEEAVRLIKVEYEVLPNVIDVEEAMRPDAPVLHEDLFTQGVDPKPTKASNIAKRMEFKLGDSASAFAKADVVVERKYKTAPVHQAYIEPHACVVSYGADGQAQVWCSSQGQFMVRAYCAKLLGMDIADIRVFPLEIGGGFGGKTLVYLEPLALALSRKSGKPVKMTMSREEVFRGSGPTSGGAINVKIGATKNGRIVAAECEVMLQAGAFPGSPIGPALMTPFAMYDLSDVTIWGYDVVSNRPKVAAYRAPGAPVSTFATESAVDELAKQLGMDPLELRLINAAKDGTKAVYGPTLKDIGFVETLEAAKSSSHWNSPLGEAAPGKRRGRGIASGFWFNIGGESSGATYVNEDGTITVVSGNPDIGGSRASMGMMAAEVLGMDVKDVRTVVGDTTSVGFSFLTGGSRVTFATGMAVTQSAEMVRDELCKRAALLWEIPTEAVEWKDGKAYPAGENAGKFDPLSVADIAAKSARTGGPITGKASINAQGAGPGYATHICDLEVDEETGHTTVLRYTAIQDVGKAIHPSYVEGQLQGGAVQGIGWALNEEYVYTKDGRLDNAGFLDYRIPVASDLPMIETILVEVPNPRHPFGVKGVGEPPIVPPMAAVANAMENATGVRMGSLPMSPPRVRAALDAAKG
jgi:CO/xanthine dehydrogenase Mo-binding subunit